MARSDPGVTVERRSGCVLATVNARRNQLRALERRVHELFGVRLPATPKCASADRISFLWTGAGQWLAVAKGAHGTAFEWRLRVALDALASVTDQSDSHVMIRVSGARARDTLAKGVSIDLHPRVFRPGDAAGTTVAYIGVQLWQVDDAPTYELLVPRSFAAAFWDWLTESAAEFGVQVADESHVA
jgi:methylglutamate dehydrogenase subunit D